MTCSPENPGDYGHDGSRKEYAGESGGALLRSHEGKILLDGTDLRSLPLKQVRSSMTVVHQDVFLFSIRCARMCVWAEKNHEGTGGALGSEKSGSLGLCQRSGPERGDADRRAGRGLSGGQKQRISIAKHGKESPHPDPG